MINMFTATMVLDSTPTFAVVPIIVNAGAAAAPAVLAGLAGTMAMLLRPSQWGRLVREKPGVLAAIVAVLLVLGAAWWWWPAGTADGGPTRGGRNAAVGGAPATDWTAVALAYLRDKEMGGGQVVLQDTSNNGQGEHGENDAKPTPVIMRLNARRNGYAGGPSPTNLRFAWTYSDPEDEFAQFLGSPAIHGRWIYASTCTLVAPASVGSLVCIDARTGERRWVAFEAPQGGRMKNITGIFSSPAVTADGKRVIVGQGLHPDRNQALLCFDTASGKLMWQAETLLHVESSPAIEGDIVVVGAGAVEDPSTGKPAPDDNPGYVLAVQISTGKLLWRQPLNDPESSPVIVNGVAYIGSGMNGNAVAAIRIADDATLKQAGQKRLVWKTPTPYPAVNPVTVHGEQLILGCGRGDIVTADPDPAGAVLAIDRATGKIDWRIDLPDTVLGAVAVYGQRAAVPVRNGEVHMIDLSAKGRTIWRTKVSDTAAVIAGPAFTGTHVYAVTDDGYLVVLEAKRGQVIERVYLNRKDRPGELRLSISAPIVANGAVYVGSETGGLHALTQAKSKAANKASNDTGAQAKP